MKLNNKGFSLVEVLAVVVILGVIATIMIPTIGSVINQNKEDNYKNLEKTIFNAAKLYISDNRYDIVLGGSCSENDGIREITKIGDKNLENGQINIKILLEEKYLSSNKIINPKNSDEELNLDNSYVVVKYNCNKRQYDYASFSEVIDTDKSWLEWETK